MTQVLYFAAVSFVFGAVVGSFLNVVIYRLPRGESLVRPGSRCPGCGTPVPFWANVPILSYLLLRGRCRACGAGIDLRYLLVELATAPFDGCVAGPRETAGGERSSLEE